MHLAHPDRPGRVERPHEVVAFHPADRRGDAIRVISDGSGVLALIRSEARFSGAVFDDPDARSEAWFTYCVEWSRSGTVYPGGLRSNDLEATCAAVAEWEGSVEPERCALIDDYRIACERAEYAAAELDAAERGTAAELGAELRARRFLAEKQQLMRRLHRMLAQFAEWRQLDPSRPPVAPPTAPEPTTRRQRVIDDAVDLLTVSGVVVGVRPDALATAAARSQLSLLEATALWPSAEQMRGELLLATARAGLADRSRDEALIETWHLLAARAPELTTSEGRRLVLTDLLRHLACRDLEVVSSSSAWRSYVACAASTAETAALSASLSAELHRSQEHHLDRLARFYENVLGQIGFRLDARLRGDHRAFAVAVSAVIEGLGMLAPAVPGILDAAYGEPDAGQQGFAPLLLTTLVAGLVEEDPEFDLELAIRRLTHGLEFETSTD